MKRLAASRPVRRVLAAAMAGALVLVIVTGALAYFTSTGGAVASADVGTLSTPVISATAGAGTVALSWSAVDPPGGGSGPVSYYVTRDGGIPAGDCPASGAPSTTTSCTDASVPAGQHTYVVTAVWASWSAPSAASTPVTVAAPTVTAATPSSAEQGANNLNVTITGTGFANGALAAFSGSGVTVNSTTSLSTTELIANVSVDPSAATGARDITVTNPSGDTATGTGAFTVNAAPTVTSASPASAPQGANHLNMTLSGTGFESGASVSFSGSGITVNSVTYNSSTSLTANVSLASGAATGSRDINVSNPDGSAGTGSGAFTVDPGPTVTSASPAAAPQGASGIGLTISGTGFESGASVSFSGSGITVNSVTYNSPTSLSANVSLASGAATGSRDIDVSNPDGSAGTGSGAFTVSPGPTVTSASPPTATQGANNLNVTISGTGFERNASASFSGSGVTVNSVTYNSSTSLTASVSISSGAATGARGLTVTNPDGSAGTSPAAFTVTQPVQPASYINTWGGDGGGSGAAGQLNLPYGLAFDGAGDLYVADFYNSRIDEFSPSMSFTDAWGWGVLDGQSRFETCTTSCQSGIGIVGVSTRQLPNGTGPIGDINGPSDVGVNSAGDVYVADSGNSRIDEFSASGSFIRAWGYDVINTSPGGFQVCTSSTGCEVGKGSGVAGAITDPAALAVDSSGDVYVADDSNDRVDEYSGTGTFIRAWGWGVKTGAKALEICTTTCRAGGAGSGTGEFYYPEGLAIDPSGNVWVSDAEYNRVQEFTPSGGFVQGLGWGVLDGKSQLETCTTTCRSGIGADNSAGGGPGELDWPEGIGFDATGNLYVADYENNRIDEFSSAGGFIQAWGGGVKDGANTFETCTTTCQAGIGGSGPGELSNPAAVKVSPSGQVFVSDTDNNRINEYSP